MLGHGYVARRGELETYFDRTAADAWSRLTSDAPVGRIRATVRAGRDRMRQTLLGWMPADLSGCRLLDAGCGTGALAIEAARRGADVVAVDLSPTLVQLGRERMPDMRLAGRVDFRVGDMLDTGFGRFDYVVAMDSLIHYRSEDLAQMLARLADRSRCGVVFTVAPRTPVLTAMHAVGRLFPRGNRAPAIVPVADRGLRRAIRSTRVLDAWRIGRTERIASGFYTSQAMELVPG